MAGGTLAPERDLFLKKIDLVERCVSQSLDLPSRSGFEYGCILMLCLRILLFPSRVFSLGSRIGSRGNLRWRPTSCPLVAVGRSATQTSDKGVHNPARV